MDLFTDSLAGDLEQRTERVLEVAICLTCRGAAHPASEPCWAACALCGATGELRSAGGRWHCGVHACGYAGAPPLEREPVPARRGRWGHHGDRTLPAFTISLDAPMEGSGFVGRYPSAEHALAHATMLYGERAAKLGSKARLTATPYTPPAERPAALATGSGGT